MKIIEEPPAEFDHEPTVKYSVIRTTAKKVVQYCRGIKNACAIPRRRVVVIDEAIKGDERDEIMRHEKAHINGWKH